MGVVILYIYLLSGCVLSAKPVFCETQSKIRKIYKSNIYDVFLFHYENRAHLTALIKPSLATSLLKAASPFK